MAGRRLDTRKGAVVDGSVRHPNWVAVGTEPERERERVCVSSELCRLVNEAAAELVQSYPTRFGALAMVPQYDAEASVDEAIYALDTLGLDGMSLNPSVDLHPEYIHNTGCGARTVL
jgi:predicted TIM-barrel fold metal-dependent hydrolase